MRYIYLFLLICPFPLCSAASNKSASIEAIYKTPFSFLQHDSLRLNIYKEKSGHHAYQQNPNLDSVKYYAAKTIEMVKKTKSWEYLPAHYSNLAHAYKKNFRLDSAEHYAQKSYILSEKLNLVKEKAISGYTLATILIDNQNLEKAIKQILLNIKFAREHHLKYYLFSNYFLLVAMNYTDGNTDPLSGYFVEKAFSFHTDSSLINASTKRKEIILKIENEEKVDTDLQSFRSFLNTQIEGPLNYKYQYLMEIGAAFLKAEKPREALSVLLPLAAIKNSKRNDSEFHIYYRITSAYLQLNQLAKAKEWHKKALKGEKKVDTFYDYPYLLKNDAIIKEKEGRYTEALKIIKEAQYWQDSLTQKRNMLNYLQVSTFENMEDLEHKVNLVTYSNDLQKTHIEKDKKIKQLLGIIVFMLLGTIALITFLFRKIKKHNSWIYAQKNELEIKTKKLNASNQIKDKLFSLLSHELRSPVAELISILDVKDKNFNPEDYNHYLTNIHAKARSIYDTMDSLLTWSASQIQLKPSISSKIDLQSVVNSLLNLKKSKIRLKNISVINQTKHTYVIANDNQTTVILRNILNNAIKFTPKGAYIRIYTIEENNFSGLAIRDSGSGIPEKKLSTIFRDVQISQSGTLGEKGNGVGLIICKELTEKQAGKIEIYSDNESGTEVRILFPKA